MGVTLGALIVAMVAKFTPLPELLPSLVPISLPKSAIKVDTTALWKHWRKAAVLLGALLLMYVGQLQIFGDPHDMPTSGSYVFIIVGLILVFVALNGAILEENGLIPVPATVEAIRFRKRWRWLVASIVLSCFVAWRTILKPQEAYLGEHVLLWIMAMVAFAISLSPMEGEPHQPDDKPLARWEYGLLIVLFLAAFAIRGIGLGSNPSVMDNDEAVFANEGASFIQDYFLITPFEPGFHSHPRIYQAMIGVSTSIFGVNLPAARLPSALMGALTIPALYLLARELRSRRAGLVAALFMLPWAYQVEFSRLAMNQPADPLFVTLSFYFLLRGLRRGAALDYAFSGFMLGVAQMFYLGGRLAPFVMIAYLGFIWLTQRELIRKQWRLILIVPLAAFLVTLPQNYYLLYFHEPLTTRADPSILVGGQLQDLAAQGGGSVSDFMVGQFKDSFLALLSTGDRSAWYGPGSNIMGPFGGPLLLIGVVMSLLIIWKRPKLALPLGWGFAVILLGSTLAVSPPEYERYFPGSVAFTLLVEMGIASVALGFAKVLEKPQIRKPLALGLASLVFIANFAFYFGVYVPAGQELALHTNYVANSIANTMVAAYNQGKQVTLIGGYDTGVEKTLIVEFFMNGKSYVYEEGAIDDALSKVDSSKPFIFIVAPKRKDDLTTIQQRLPGGTTREVTITQDDTFGYYIYESSTGTQSASSM